MNRLCEVFRPESKRSLASLKSRLSASPTSMPARLSPPSTASILVIFSTCGILLANEGIDGNLRKAFVVYILSHNRPMAEVLAPARLDIEAEFSRGFEGMTEASVTLHELLHARETLIADIVGNMPPDHRRFLVSF